jgi:hypothetical protein
MRRRPEELLHLILLHLDNVEGDQAVRLSMNLLGHVRVGSIDETERLLPLVVEPVAQEPNIVLGLDAHVQLVRGRHIGSANAIEIVPIDVQGQS